MIKPGKTAVMLMAAGAFIASLSSCQKKQMSTDDKGPAEKAGQQVDQAAARAGQELNKIAEKAGKSMEQAGQKLQKEASDAQKKE